MIKEYYMIDLEVYQETDRELRNKVKEMSNDILREQRMRSERLNSHKETYGNRKRKRNRSKHR